MEGGRNSASHAMEELSKVNERKKESMNGGIDKWKNERMSQTASQSTNKYELMVFLFS